MATAKIRSVTGWMERAGGPWALAVGGLVIALIALASYFIGRGTPVAVAIAKRGDAAAVVYATGVVEPVYWAKISALQRKRIVEICHCEGAAVKRGEVLVRLDDGEERAFLVELQARLQRFQDDVVRIRPLVQRNITSQLTLDEKLTQVREYEARIAAQKDRIEDLALKSPIDGVVLRRNGEVGEIAGTEALMWVGQPKPLRIVAEVNEDDIAEVEPGHKTLLRHEGHRDGLLEATVERITPKGDPETKTFRVYLALPQQSPLMIGMSVEANIIVDDAKGVVLVPAEAIGNGHVAVVDGRRAMKRPVETGIRGTRLVEIRKGVAEGERVVSPYVPGLEDGARVRARPATSE
jgi:membrane fusion protein (multidrug efflux system)